ncbi:uncharacterized protein LOC125842795 [Solanum stenotomum]|uniref:uncharacterized protein LOC125842795 n=1 Tax=Solanum stenotomum TaxID=172797 RepID=UPI0020D0CFBD|nr:uncharacterized protein LOC125842795 [Solanum stenotomum]
MNTRGRPAGRVGEENVNEGVSPQGHQDVQVSVEVPDMTNEEIKSTFLILARAMAAQATRDVGPRVNANEGTMVSNLRDFVRMNPLVFLGSKANTPVGADPIEWEDFKKAFLGRDEMSRFVTSLSDLVKEECHTAMLHSDMNISRLIVYGQSIEESKLKRMNRDVKRGRYDEQGQPRIKQRAPNQDSSSAPKRHYGKCLASTNGCYGCGKNDQKVKDCPTLTARGMETKQASKDGAVPIPPNYSRFYALQANKDKEANPDESTGK